MKVKFISYADGNMTYSLRRIGRQARRLGIFDEVILYTPDMLPAYIRQSPLMQYPRGGGYWSWKPAIIDETLQHSEDGDVVVYVDAGCTLRKGKNAEWNLFIRLLQKYDTVCFQYDESQPQWEKWGSKSSKIKYWSKKSTQDYFVERFGDDSFLEEGHIMGGILFMKNKRNSFLRNWLDIVLNHPELILDPTPEEAAAQPAGFAGHRHDQSVITPLALNDPTVIVLPEIIEKEEYDGFIWASRIRARHIGQCWAFHIKHFFRRLLGAHVFESVKRLIKK